MSELPIIILCAVVAALGIFLYLYNKKNANANNELINSITVSLIETLTAYIKKNGKKEAKKFDELSDYVIYVKDYLFKQIEEAIEDSEKVPTKMKKIFSEVAVDSILDNIISDNMGIIEKAFEDSKKTTKKSKTTTKEVSDTTK